MTADNTSSRSESQTKSTGGEGGWSGSGSPVSRRRFLDVAQATGAAVTLGALAGCAGGDGGDGSGGGDGSDGGGTPSGGQTTTAQTSRKMEEVKFSFVPSTATAPIWLAQEFGYFEERGITITGTTSISGSKETAQLGTGQLDHSVGAVGASTFNAIANDVSIKFSCDEASATPGLPIGNRYYIRDGLWQDGMTFEDVETPVTIATNAPASVGEYMLARTIAIHDNLSWDSVKVELLPFPQMISAMGSESIDIAQQIDPLGPVMEQKLNAHFLEYSNRPTPDQQVAGIIVGGPFLEKRPEVARKWHEAYILGIRDLYELGGYAGEEVAPVVAKALDRDESSIVRAIPYLPNKNGKLQEDNVVAQQEYLACQGYVEKPVSREEMFANDVREAALDEIGRVPEEEERVGQDVMDSMMERSPISWPRVEHKEPNEFLTDEICGHPLSTN